MGKEKKPFCCHQNFVPNGLSAPAWGYIYNWAASWQNQQNGMCAQQSLISLCIRTIWSEFSLCSQWVAKDPSFLHADSKDSDQTGWMPRPIWVFTGHTCHFVGFVMRWLMWWNMTKMYIKSDFKAVFLNLQQMGKRIRVFCWHQHLSPRGCLPLPWGYIHV